VRTAQSDAGMLQNLVITDHNSTLTGLPTYGRPAKGFARGLGGGRLDGAGAVHWHSMNTYAWTWRMRTRTGPTNPRSTVTNKGRGGGHLPTGIPTSEQVDVWCARKSQEAGMSTLPIPAT
jgi:hypothetical protein